MVLLKNDGVLPLRSPRRIAIVGPLADQTRVLLGNYTGMPTHTVSVLEGMKAEFPHAEITFVPGTPFLANGDRSGRAPPVYPANTAPAPAAIAAARQAEVIVAVVGITSRLEGEEMPIDLPGFVGGDRTSLDLPRPEEELVEALAATHKPLVVVLMNGSALSVNWEKAHADAILEAWYAGEEGGTAVAETLSGKNDPAGRLPVTFYQGVHQLPHFEDYSMKGRTYRYFQGEPLWPFGYGLSYTSFRYGGLILPKAPLRAGDPLDVAVTVTNTGKRAGDEVVQLYLKFPDVPGAPLRALRGFERVHLAPGASRKVAFHLKPRDLSLVTAAGDILIAQGAYTLSIGGGQPGTEAPSVSGRFEVGGQLLLPELGAGISGGGPPRCNTAAMNRFHERKARRSMSTNLHRLPAALAALAACILAACVEVASAAPSVAPPADWPEYNRTLAGDRYSPLAEITAANVGQLTLRCAYTLPEVVSFQTGPLVIDGTMYFTTFEGSYAIDAARCTEKWSRRRKSAGLSGLAVNRGFAYLDGRLFRGTGDAHVI